MLPIKILKNFQLKNILLLNYWLKQM